MWYLHVLSHQSKLNLVAKTRLDFGSWGCGKAQISAWRFQNIVLNEQVWCVHDMCFCRMSTQQERETHVANRSEQRIPSAVLRQRIQVHQLEQMGHPNLCIACNSSKTIGPTHSKDLKRYLPRTWPLNSRRSAIQHESPSSPLRLPERESLLLSLSNSERRIELLVTLCSLLWEMHRQKLQEKRPKPEPRPKTSTNSAVRF